MALINKLNAIGDAIREKTGKTELLTLEQMPIEIAAIETGGGGEGLPEEAFLITGNCNFRFALDGWTWFIKEYGNKITTKDITNLNQMFAASGTLEEIPFDLNVSASCSNLNQVFYNCSGLKEVPLIKGEVTAPTNNYDGKALDSLFYNCQKLRSILYDYFRNFGGDTFWEASQKYRGSRGSIFYNCYSLRQLPDMSMLKTLPYSASQSLYYNMCNACYVLDEIIDLPVIDGGAVTSNTFSSTFSNCYRLKEMIFATQDDGTPYTAQWKNQTIDLSSKVGYTGNVSNKTYITGYNSGLTTDTEIASINDYPTLKDNPDSWTAYYEVSRYNHDSAVNTINSLPDTSAYGTNIIKFNGNAGAKTDGGAINTLTEAEIAVAAAKGWTVTLV